MKKEDVKMRGWWSWCGCCDKGGGTLLWGLLIVVVGGYYLGRDLGWIPRDIELWPILVLTVGIGMLFGNLRRWNT